MSVINILFRVDEICKKYDKYDIDERHELINASSDDAFARLYSSFEAQIEAAYHKAETISMETNMAASVALKAEVRRIKARLMDEVPKLQKLSQKKVKGISKDELEARAEMVLILPERIQAIPDSTTGDQVGACNSSDKQKIHFDSEGDIGGGFFQQSEESNQFREEYEMRRMKQDQGLDIISDGLDTLKNLAHDMNEELDKQVPLIDEIDVKVDKATAELKNTNTKLKETLNNVRSSQNFCIDFVLICIILGIATYLYNTLK